jgi:hypothetical protein
VPVQLKLRAANGCLRTPSAVKHGAFIATQLIPRFDLAPGSEDYAGFMSLYIQVSRCVLHFLMRYLTTLSESGLHTVG